MPTLRNILLSGIFVVAMTAWASPAGAQTLEVRDEATFNHCPPVTVVTHGATGGCPVHFSSTASLTLRMHVFGIESTTNVCSGSEFIIRFDEDASGYAVDQATSGCTDVPCFEGATPSNRFPWQVTGREEAPDEKLRIAFCFSEITQTCVVDAPVRHLNQHQLEIGTKVNGVPQEIPRVSGTIACEIAGHWLSEEVDFNETNVEIAHTF